ncbi:MAG: phosphoserine phosphatase SerB, partial [archaeon]|nr:phosphoserine phosphatase SerB [archaeon]
QGEIDFETSIKDRVQLLEGTAVEDIQNLAKELSFIEGAEDTIKALKEKDLEIAVISGSFDIIADEVKDKLGIDYAYYNTFVVEDGKLTGEVEGPLVSCSKLDVLNELIAEKDISLEDVVAVGDGANDISMIEAAGCGIAFNAKDSVKEIADVIIEEKDLTKVLDCIDQPTEDDAEEEVVEEAVEEDEATEDVEEESDSDDSLPKSDFVLADTIEGVRQQKDEKEAEIAQITEEREEFNRIAKEQRKIRDELNASLKENLNKAIEFRNDRNNINKEVEAAKKERNEANNKIKNLEWSSGKRDKVKLENEIRKIDKIIETRVLDIKKENQLVKNANDLRKQLHEIKEDESVKAEAQELKKLSEEAHAKVIELSEKAQEAHEEMLKFFRATDDIRTAADEAHKKFIEARKNASAKHDEFKVVLADIRVINKKLGSNRPKRRKSDKKSSGSNKNQEEKEKAEAIFEKFKNGGKLSTEELLLLQKYNIG